MDLNVKMSLLFPSIISLQKTFSRTLHPQPRSGDGWAGEFLGAAARFARDRRSNTAPSSSQPGWAAKYLQACKQKGCWKFD